jgi:hypothetical protein
MLVELNHEAVDGLMKSILIQDYQGLVSDNKRLAMIKDKQPYQFQDMAHNLRYIEAMEILMEYYVGFDWRNEIDV